MPPLEAVIFLSLWAFGLGQLKLEQPEISISRAIYKSAQIPCKVSSGTFSSDYIHWYRQKPDQKPAPPLPLVCEQGPQCLTFSLGAAWCTGCHHWKLSSSSPSGPLALGS
nr:T cell receptor gamma variable 11 (non-functional) [Myotis myotis]